MAYTILAILLFGILIGTHEAGHMFAAKAFGVKVNEYAIGMGPALWKRKKGETQYSLRLFPVGGFCDIEGESGNSDDPRSLCAQSAWKQVVVFLGGVTVNFITGVLILCCLYFGAVGFVNTEITSLRDGFPCCGEEGVMVGDRIYSINGERTYLQSDVGLVIMATEGSEHGDLHMVVDREGELLSRTIPLTNYTEPDGSVFTGYGFSFGGEDPATFGTKLKYVWYNTIDFVRTVRLNFQIIANGNASFDDFRGPVGIVSEITSVGEEAEKEAGIGAALEDVFYFAAMLAINLAVMNMLPIPALDGGRVLLLFLDIISMKLFKKKVNHKVVELATAGSFVVVLLFMAIISYKDIIRLFV